MLATTGAAAPTPTRDELVREVDQELLPQDKLPSARLQRQYLRLHERAADNGEDPGRNIVRDGAKTRDGEPRLFTAREVKRSLRVLRRMAPPEPEKTAVSPQLQAIANCESHGDPTAVGGGGAYRGKYQFNTGTWASVGGKGDPAAAPEAEQDKRAAMLLARDGAGHWPNCGQ